MMLNMILKKRKGYAFQIPDTIPATSLFIPEEILRRRSTEFKEFLETIKKEAKLCTK